MGQGHEPHIHRSRTRAEITGRCTRLPMKVLVCGSREWTNPGPIERELRKLRVPYHGGLYEGPITIVHGANGGRPPGGGRPIGADFIAGELAQEMGYRVRAYPVTSRDWSIHGRAAGPIRNSHMLEVEHVEGEPIELCLAFAVDFGRAFGTRDMTRKAEGRGIRVERFST